MSAPAGDGSTQRDHIIAAAEGTFPDATAIAMLDNEPLLPEGCNDVWAIFLDLHSRRAVSEHGPVRFSWHDIYAYQAANDLRLTGWQLKTVFELETEYYKVRAEFKI